MKKKRGFLLLVLLLLLAGACVFLRYRSTHDPLWISRSEALHIAVRDAGTSEGRVYDVETRLLREEGRTVYEIGFTDHTAQYAYTIDAESSEILLRSKTES